MSITIITDGSADNKIGEGGWAALVRMPNSLIELTGWEENTTSNRMELMAVIEGLRSVKIPSDITIVSDSAYVLNTMKQRWYERWFEEHSVGLRSKPRPNIDLWYQLAGLAEFHDITWVKVKGHSGDYWNERADKLADRARREQISLRLEIDRAENLRCTTVSYGKQCYLYADHSGECKWGKHEAVFEGV